MSELPEIEGNPGEILAGHVTSTGTARIQFVKPLRIEFKPLEDITAFELAKCLPYLIRQHPIMPYEIDKSDPAFRHFVIHDEN